MRRVLDDVKIFFLFFRPAKAPLVPIKLFSVEKLCEKMFILDICEGARESRHRMRGKCR